MKLLISLSIILLFQQNLLLTFVNKCQFYKITSKRVYHCYHNLDLFRTLYVNFVSSTMSQRLQVRNTLFFCGGGCFVWLPRWLTDKDSIYQWRRHGFDPWVGKISWRRKWQPLQYSCLGDPMDRGAWQATVHGIAESDVTQRLSTSTRRFVHLVFHYYQ